MKITERTYDITTGKTVDVERDETATEVKSREDAIAVAQARLDEAALKMAARQEVFTKLGLNADEAAALLG